MTKPERKSPRGGDPTAKQRDATAPSTHGADLMWRFLLGDGAEPFEQVVVLGGDATVGELARELGVARDVSTTLPSRSTADCVVVMPSFAGVMKTAMSAVHSDGIVLVHVDRTRGGRWFTQAPSRVTRLARDCGLVPHGLWAAAPARGAPRRMIPLDHPYALRYYLRTLFVEATVGTTLFAAAIRVTDRVLGIGTIRRLVPAYFAVFGSPGARERTLAAAGLADAPTATWLTPMLLTSGQDDASRIVFLPFTDREREPVAVVKASSAPRHARWNDDEHNRLAALRERCPEEVARALPQPRSRHELGGRSVTVQSLARGRSTERSAGALATTWRRRVAELDKAAKWLLSFHDATRGDALTWTDDHAERCLVAPLRELLVDVEATGELPDDVDAEALLRAVRDVGTAAAGVRLPTVERAYDFVPCNVFSDPGGVTVVDWEPLERAAGATDTGLPVMDLLLFVTHWYFLVTRAWTPTAELDALRALAREPARRQRRAHAAARAAVDRYCDGLAVDRSVVDVTSVALWVERAHASRARVRRVGERRGPDERTVKYLRYLGVAAEAGRRSG